MKDRSFFFVWSLPVLMHSCINVCLKSHPTVYKFKFCHIFFHCCRFCFVAFFFLLFLLPFDTLSLNWISDLYFNLADISFSRSISIWLVSCNATKVVCVYIFIVCKWLASRTNRHQLIVLLEFRFSNVRVY